MKEYTFSELQAEILKSLNKLEKEGFFGKERSLTILDGFTYINLQNRIGPGSVMEFNGRALPMVAVIDDKTGQVWHFSVKQLVPRIELN